MKSILGKIGAVLLFIVFVVVAVPVVVVWGVIELIAKMLFAISDKFWQVRKYSEKKVRRKLEARIKKVVRREGEIYLCKDFWISPDEYSLYTTLKYLFTGNKEDFECKRGCDKYLFNYYDLNAHKEDFVEKWIRELKGLNSRNINVQEATISTPDSSEKSVLKISCKNC